MDRKEAIRILEKMKTRCFPDGLKRSIEAGKENEAIDFALVDMKICEANNRGWIPVSDRLPPEHDTIFAKLKGTDKCRDAMFEKQSEDVRVVFRFEDGTRRVGHSHTVDGVWECEKPNKYPKRTVTHWCENPTLPEEEA